MVFVVYHDAAVVLCEHSSLSRERSRDIMEGVALRCSTAYWNVSEKYECQDSVTTKRFRLLIILKP